MDPIIRSFNAAHTFLLRSHLVLRKFTMEIFLLILYLLTLVSAANTGGKVSYDGHRVFRIEIDDNLPRVNGLLRSLLLSTWNRATNTVDVVVPPGKSKIFQEKTANITTHVMHEDLGASIAEEARYKNYLGKYNNCCFLGYWLKVYFQSAGTANSTWFDSYHLYADHIQFLEDLQALFPTNSEIVVAGNSSSSQPITGIHIYGNRTKGVNPAVVFHGTVHAREWITTGMNFLYSTLMCADRIFQEVTEYIAFTLLHKYSNDVEISRIMNSYDFYVYPIVNPDGELPTYKYFHVIPNFDSRLYLYPVDGPLVA